MKNSLEGFKGRFEQAEETIRKLQDRTIEIIKLEEQKGKRWKKSEFKCKDMWDITNWTNICIMGVPEEGRKGYSRKLPKLDERHEYKNAKSSRNSKIN